MLNLYRRHLETCKHISKGRSHKSCKCPIWVDGQLAGARLHKSMKMLDWDRACAKARDWEIAGKIEPEVEPTTTVERAVDRFTTDAKNSRKLKTPTLKKYRVLFDQLKAFCANRGIRYTSQITLESMEDFQASWADGPISASKKLERLRAFFAFMLKHGWVAANYAANLSTPKIDECPTLPFTGEEMAKLIDHSSGRLRALILLLRYSGLRVQDAASCAVSRLIDNKLLLYMAKTKQPVYCALPSMCLQALADVERTSEAYWFWTGDGSKDTLAGNYRRSLRKLGKRAGVENVHPHRFRDTFAVELLLAGVPMERVSVLLGHKSLKVTERHYAPWVHARQVQLEADVRNAWDKDPILQADKPLLKRVK